MDMNKNNICNNCGKQGHLLHQCKLPITSYGIIVFKKNKNNEFKYLMLRRKDSFGYIDFIRGKYSPYNIYQIQNIINEMSNAEKNSILVKPFDELWKNMWVDNLNNNQYKNEEILSAKKMELIINGININGETVTLEEIVKSSETIWKETEWEFPKGRRNMKEKDLDCALREFEEETGISEHHLTIVDNVLPFEEVFIGTNHKSYKHKYYLAYMKDENDEMCALDKYQISEVSKLEWKTLDECLESIRPYNLEKKNLIINIDKVLKKYRLYS
jgi:8-oxo-dGTP pyrophosphatase MutT (NUDIX family)